jgi:hypothetical protein
MVGHSGGYRMVRHMRWSPRWLLRRRHTHDVAGLAGLRRVESVLISVHDGTVCCRVRGVGHRLAWNYPISLGTALKLRAAGVPTRVDRRRTSPAFPHGLTVPRTTKPTGLS